MPCKNGVGVSAHARTLWGSGLGVAGAGGLSDHMTLEDEGWDRRRGLEQPYCFLRWSPASSYEPCSAAYWPCIVISSILGDR